MEKFAKEFGMSFERGTDIGFHMDEIKQNSTEDLLVLKSSIYTYLKLKKLKKRNSKYMDVYIRINKELSLRESQTKTKENLEKQYKTNEEISKEKNSFSAQKLFEFFETQKNKEKEDELLSKKIKSSSKVDIPNFLNDKNNEQIKNKKEFVKQYEEKSYIINFKENLDFNLNNNYNGN